MKFSIHEFAEARADGRTLSGVTLTHEEPLVMVLRGEPGGTVQMVGVERGLAITGLLGPAALEGLELTLPIALDAAKKLYAGMGQMVQIEGASPLTRYRARFRLADDKLKLLAKHVPATGDAAERVIALLKAVPALLDDLGEWQLVRLAPQTGD